MKFWRDTPRIRSRATSSWFLTEDQRWRHLPADLDTKALIKQVNREDLWREAAKRIGVPAAEIPSSPSRGKETFFDGKVFDPENPAAYLASLAIKARGMTMSERMTTMSTRWRRRPGPAHFRTRLGGAARVRQVACGTPCLRCSRLGLLLGIWELLCRGQGAALPPPSQVISDTWQLIVDPFFDHGGVDKGMFWHIAASLKRVALGFSLAACGRHRARRADRSSRASPIAVSIRSSRCCGPFRRSRGCRSRWPRSGQADRPRSSSSSSPRSGRSS
jgi:hypothetical protein